MSAMLQVTPGPSLFAAINSGPGLRAHRVHFGELPKPTRDHLVRAAESIRGRGGAGFPFAGKLKALGHSKRPVLVVNWAEGEPASHKDAALARVLPHLVLDGALLAARAYGVRSIHLVLPGEQDEVVASVREAVAERPEARRFKVHLAEDWFVAGQARAVLELMAGRPNLPVTAWRPEVYDGFKGKPTLLSNAETWAQLARCVLMPEAQATTLLTFGGESGAPNVSEVVLGSRFGDALPANWSADVPVLVGGYHGVWTTVDSIADKRIDHDSLRAAGVPLGAGVVLTVSGWECPITMTARILDYLASQSAKRCGPCLNGLPELARNFAALAQGQDTRARLGQLCGLVERRGACAHPDGTARLARSAMSVFPAEVAAHLAGRCSAKVEVVA